MNGVEGAGRGLHDHLCEELYVGLTGEDIVAEFRLVFVAHVEQIESLIRILCFRTAGFVILRKKGGGILQNLRRSRLLRGEIVHHIFVIIDRIAGIHCHQTDIGDRHILISGGFVAEIGALVRIGALIQIYPREDIPD